MKTYHAWILAALLLATHSFAEELSTYTELQISVRDMPGTLRMRIPAHTLRNTATRSPPAPPATPPSPTPHPPPARQKKHLSHIRICDMNELRFLH